jgi:hypothetical protein
LDDERRHRRPSVQWTLVLVVGLVLTACDDGANAGHSFGRVHTPIGDATIGCGGAYSRSCSTGSGIAFPECTAAYDRYFAPINRHPRLAALDRRVRDLVHRNPPSGTRWSDTSCGTPPPEFSAPTRNP